MRAYHLALLLVFAAAPARAAGAAAARTAPRQQPATGVAPITLPPMAPQAQAGSSLAGALDMGGVLRLPGAVPLVDPSRMPRAGAIGFRPDLAPAPLPESAVAPRAEAAVFLETFAPRQALPLTAPPPAEATVLPGSPLAQQSALVADRQAAVAEAASSMAREASPGAETSQAFGDRVWTLLLGQKPARGAESEAAPETTRWSDLGASRPQASASGEVALAPASERAASERRDPASARLTVPGVAAEVERILSWPSRVDLSALLSGGAPSVRPARSLVLPIRRLALRIYSMALGVYASAPSAAGEALASVSSLPASARSARGASAGRLTAAAGAQTLRDAVASPASDLAAARAARAASAVAADPAAEAERFAFLQDSGERLPLDEPAFSPPLETGSAARSRARNAGPAPVAFLAITLLPVLGAALMLASRE